MDPLTFALEAYIVTTKLLDRLWSSASPEQQKRLLEIHIKREEFWQRAFDKFGDVLQGEGKAKEVIK